MYLVFSEWCKENGFKQMNNSTFGKKLRGLGFEHRKSRDDFYWNLDWKKEYSYLANRAATLRNCR